MSARGPVHSPAELFEDGALTFGIGAPTTRAEVLELEQADVAGLWIGGHVASVNASPEALMGLARTAAYSSTAMLGTSILLLPLYPPAIVAKQIADLDRATDGRIVLGVGVGGEYPQEFRACGVPMGERGARTDEAIALIRRLWTGEEVTHDGRYYPMSEVKIQPVPQQPGGPPIVVSGRKAPAMRRAATLGDGWMPYLYSPRRYHESVAEVRQFATAAGRELSRFAWMLYTFVNIGDDGDEARRQLATFLGGTYRQDFDQMVSHVTVAGTVDDVVTRLTEYVDAGARQFVLIPCPRPGEPTNARLLLDEVIPTVRASTNAATLSGNGS